MDRTGNFAVALAFIGFAQINQRHIILLHQSHRIARAQCPAPVADFILGHAHMDVGGNSVFVGEMGSTLEQPAAMTIAEVRAAKKRFTRVSTVGDAALTGTR